MANPDFDEMATSTLDLKMKEACQQLGRECFTIAKLEKTAKTQTGGHMIRENISAGDNDNHKWFNGYDPLPMGEFKSLSAIQNPWTEHAIAISFCERELKLNRGEHQLVNLLTHRIKETERSLKEIFNRSILHNDGSDPLCIAGLPLLLGKGPYGGIDPNKKGCEYWLPYCCDPLQDWLDAGNAAADFVRPPFTWKKLDEMALCIDGGKSRPDCLILSKDLYLGLKRMLESQFHFQNTEMVKLGVESINYMGMDIGFDFDMAPGSWYALNTEYITWWRQAGCFMESTGFKTPHNQMARIAHIYTMQQLTTCKRNAHAVGRCFAPAC